MLFGFFSPFYLVKVSFFISLFLLLCSPITCLLYCTLSLESDNLGELNQSFNKSPTAVGFDKWGGWSGTLQKKSEGGRIGPGKINSSWSCWLPHFITSVSKFSGCLQLFLPTNYSSRSPQARAVNLVLLGRMEVVSLSWAPHWDLDNPVKGIVIPYYHFSFTLKKTKRSVKTLEGDVFGF